MAFLFSSLFTKACSVLSVGYPLRVVTENGKAIRVVLSNSDCKVHELKRALCRKLCIPVNLFVLFKEGRQLTEEETVGSLGQPGEASLIQVTCGVSGAVKSLGRIQLDPLLDVDLINAVDDGERYHWNGLPYRPPVGWYVYGLDNSRRKRHSRQVVRRNAAISFSAVHPNQVESVCRHGYVNSEVCFPNCPVPGIISTANPAAAERMASTFSFGGKAFKVIIENRMNPCTMSKETWNDPQVGEFYVSPSAADITPVAVLIKELMGPDGCHVAQ